MSEHNWYLAKRDGLQLLTIARPIAAYWRLRSAASMQAGEAMLLMSSFCSSVNFVIREAPPEPGLHCPVTSVEANEPFEDAVGGSCKNKL